ncbi:hypothetical protein K504DRAFT_378558 [Pleomassaria siparia CBS 279.74]|uniref:RBR-type E3 ubiquitin transferase n=1 Tax=Pleomassaria siparia CBS 279.74 TaxID=1314801 RepID=A0A6G1KA08_9PLEO|nr:hypothetical protein K504DRAFT_378558 [Pleomassaria siparia CBS 279.74]
MAQQLYEEQEEEERKEREIRNRRRDCVVCRDSFLPGEFASLVDCLHQPEVCTECFAQWISSEIKDGSWREIKCPGTDCGLALKYHEVQQLATPESFAELDNLLFRDALGGDDNFRWCRAEGCQSGQVHESGHAGNIFRCVGCGFRVCVIHDKTWHEGETCDEYDYRISGEKEKDEQKKLQVEQEQASCEAIGKLSKKCPGIKCAWNIQKNDGCDHMTCSRCRHEFCWVCLAPYKDIRRKGNIAHTEQCKYHSNRLN